MQCTLHINDRKVSGGRSVDSGGWPRPTPAQCGQNHVIPLYTILPEICAFIIGFSCTVWTKMRPLAGPLADGVLVDALLIPSRTPLPPTNIRKVRGPRKKYGN